MADFSGVTNFLSGVAGAAIPGFSSLQNIGSNIGWGQAAQAFAPPVQAANYSQPNASQVPANFFSSQAPTGYTPTGGGGTTPSGPNVAQVAPPQNPNAVQQVSPYFDQAMGILNNALGSTQALGGQIEQGLGTFQKAQQGQIEQNRQESQQQVGQQRTEEQNQAQSAIGQARRGAAELMRNQEAFYGSAVPTGQFISGLVGANTQTATGNMQNQLGAQLSKLDFASQNINKLAQQHLLDLQSQVQSSLTQAKTQLNDQLNQIRLNQSALQTQKASLAYEAIQTYQNQVNQINQANAAMQNQIQAQELYVQGLVGQQKQTYLNQIPNLGYYNQFAPNFSNFMGGGTQGGMLNGPVNQYTNPLLYPNQGTLPVTQQQRPTGLQ